MNHKDTKTRRGGSKAATLLLLLCAFVPLWFNPAFAAETVHQIIARAIVEEDADKKAALIRSLAGLPDDGEVRTLLGAWKEDTIFIHKDGEAKVPVLLSGEKDADEKQAAVRLDRPGKLGEPLAGPDQKPIRLAAGDLDTAEHDSALRAVMKGVLDILALAAPNRAQRLAAINTFGMAQDPEKLPALLAAQKSMRDPATQHALREAIALIQLKDADPQNQITGCRELAALGSIPSQDFLKQLLVESKDNQPVAAAAQQALDAIAAHLKAVNLAGTVFHGVGAGSVLLVVAIGLAITFGLMGVINMAHGELIAVGAYATYLVQCLFGTGFERNIEIIPHRFTLPLSLRGFGLTGAAYDSYFFVALPVAFITAAMIGIALERGIIRFLYRRPQESLLATWGVSLCLQQAFRIVFGSNNVQVDSPSWLASNWAFHDVQFRWSYLFIIGSSVVIILGTQLILKRTPLGLLIRAVMQNRHMAACMGVRTERVNMLTFGFGSGLAGLAGAFLTQIGNVGPNMGQAYIVDTFMTVVVGGVGNLAGTVISALGIGLIDQSLQQILLNPVLGKIMVLGGIILFLQWRPAGLFVTKSRSLEG